MGARRDLGHHATIGRVQVGLAADDGGKQHPLAAHITQNRGGGVVAAAFKAEEGKGRGHGRVSLQVGLGAGNTRPHA